MKKEVENKNSFITDLSSSESSGDESDDNKEIPIENKKEIKEVIENYLLSSDDEKTIKKIPPRKEKRLLKREILLLAVVMIKIKKNQLNQSNPKKSKRNPPPKTHSRKHLWKVMISKDFKKRQKKRGATSLDYSKRNKSPLRGHVVTDISRELC